MPGKAIVRRLHSERLKTQAKYGQLIGIEIDVRLRSHHYIKMDQVSKSTWTASPNVTHFIPTTLLNGFSSTLAKIHHKTHSLILTKMSSHDRKLLA